MENSPKHLIGAVEYLDGAKKEMIDRAATYDSPGGEKSMCKAVAALNAIAGEDIARTGMRECHGWLLMLLVKQVRQFSRSAPHKDSAVDSVAYAALMAEARMLELRATTPNTTSERLGCPGWFAKGAAKLWREACGTNLTDKEKGPELLSTATKVADDGPVYDTRSWYDLFREVTRKKWMAQDASLAFREPTRSEMSKAENDCQGSHFTDRELHDILESERKRWTSKICTEVKRVDIPDVHDYKLGDAAKDHFNKESWQFSDEMWEYAYCNPKNAQIFEEAKKRWKSHGNDRVSIVLVDKDRFNGSDLTVDGIHVPSLPKELINAALLRLNYSGGSMMDATAMKAGIAFTVIEEDK